MNKKKPEVKLTARFECTVTPEEAERFMLIAKAAGKSAGMQLRSMIQTLIECCGPEDVNEPIREERAKICPDHNLPLFWQEDGSGYCLECKKLGLCWKDSSAPVA